LASTMLMTALVLPVYLLAQDVPADLGAFAGTYTGEVFNGDDMDPIVTVFRMAGGNRLTASYSVDAEQFTYEGVVSSIVFEDERTITGEWTDRFGEGFLRLQFSVDFNSFTGYWSDYDSTSELPWHGSKSR